MYRRPAPPFHFRVPVALLSNFIRGFFYLPCAVDVTLNFNSGRPFQSVPARPDAGDHRFSPQMVYRNIQGSVLRRAALVVCLLHLDGGILPRAGLPVVDSWTLERYLEPNPLCPLLPLFYSFLAQICQMQVLLFRQMLKNKPPPLLAHLRLRFTFS
jgi:hypothetical protein